jgi:hypothetical protein
VIHFLQILLVVWLMAKTMCLAVKGTMFLMFVRYGITGYGVLGPAIFSIPQPN